MAEPMIRDIMRTTIPAVDISDSIAKVAQTLVDHQIPGVLVMDGDKLVGIVSEGDLITRQADLEIPTSPLIGYLDAIFSDDSDPNFDEEIRRVLARTAGDLMTEPVINIRDSATLNEVATLMHERNLNPVPIVNDQMELVGIVSRSDLVKILAKLEAASQRDESANEDSAS